MSITGSHITHEPVQLEALLREHSVFPTAQRMAIARVLLVRHQHVTADQLHTRLKDKGFLVSKATVYNTLGLFVTQGLLKEIFIDPSCVYYDSNISHHHHFYNIDSGELTDISEDLLPRFHNTQTPDGTELQDIDIVIRVKNRSA
jgi:Fur family iron response transcriptional regulator